LELVPVASVIAVPVLPLTTMAVAGSVVVPPMTLLFAVPPTKMPPARLPSAAIPVELNPTWPLNTWLLFAPSMIAMP
jgi:hypothetical protein